VISNDHVNGDCVIGDYVIGDYVIGDYVIVPERIGFKIPNHTITYH
jgi:hypothetical protein